MNVVSMLRNEKDVTAVPAGQVIFREGDPGDAMYAVLEGTVDIKYRENLVEQIESGGIFGEMGLVDGQPRSADAIAGSDVKLARITEDRFMALSTYNPFFALSVLRVTVERLRRRMK